MSLSLSLCLSIYLSVYLSLCVVCRCACILVGHAHSGCYCCCSQGWLRVLICLGFCFGIFVDGKGNSLSLFLCLSLLLCSRSDYGCQVIFLSHSSPSLSLLLAPAACWHEIDKVACIFNLIYYQPVHPLVYSRRERGQSYHVEVSLPPPLCSPFPSYCPLTPTAPDPRAEFAFNLALEHKPEKCL